MMFGDEHTPPLCSSTDAPLGQILTGQHRFLMLADTVLLNSITHKHCQAVLAHSITELIILSHDGIDLNSFSFCDSHAKCQFLCF